MRAIKLQDFSREIVQTDLFKVFDARQLWQLLNSSFHSIVSYDRGQTLYQPYEKCQTMDVVCRGKISMQTLGETGRMMRLAVLGTSSVMGASLLFATQNWYSFTVAADSDAVLLRLYKDTVLRLCQENAVFTEKLLTLVVDKTQVRNQMLGTQQDATIRQKVMDFLRQKYIVQKNQKINLGMTKKELAKRMGVHRSSLGRELKNMRDDGVIAFDVHHIWIKDVAGIDRE